MVLILVLPSGRREGARRLVAILGPARLGAGQPPDEPVQEALELIARADLNLAATLCEPWENRRVDGELDPADYGLHALADWLARCTGRASWEHVRSLP